jgi:hypothetical protein
MGWRLHGIYACACASMWFDDHLQGWVVPPAARAAGGGGETRLGAKYLRRASHPSSRFGCLTHGRRPHHPAYLPLFSQHPSSTGPPSSPARRARLSRSAPIPAMEPPTKRLRILKSVDVDEDNHEYIRKKRDAEAQLKNQFESIFAKYENMTEDMSDEIDMVRGAVVVDRGHLRSLEGKPNAMRAAGFLEDLLVGDSPGDVIDSYDEDEMDELAPPEPPIRKSMRESDDPVHASDHVALMPPTIAPIAPFSVPIQPEITNTTLQIPQTPASLMQLAQLPPTPASLTALAQLAPTPENQLVQNNFLAAFSQTMVQAVHQAFSIASLMGNASNATLPNTPFIPSAVAPATVDKVVPATNPKWYFPPLPQNQFAARAAQSSPISASDGLRKRRRSLTENMRKGPIKRKSTNNASKTTPITASVTSRERASAQTEMEIWDESNAVASQPDTPAQSQPKTSRGNTTYVFSREDDLYLIEHKEVKKRSWLEIKDGQSAWKDWPMSVIRIYYLDHLRGRNSKLKNTVKSNEHIVEAAVDANSPQARKFLGAEVNITVRPSDDNIISKRRKNKSYTFSSDDNRYIVEQRKIHRLSWAEIKNSRAKWQDWPMSAFHNHWYHDLRKRLEDFMDVSIDKRTEIEIVCEESGSLGHDEVGAQIEAEDLLEEQDITSPNQRRQLLTPSSLQHSGSSDTRIHAETATANTATPLVEFDEEDLQLTIAESQDIGSPPPEETVVQSIETDIVMGEDDDSNSVLYASSLVEEHVQSPLRSTSIIEESEPVINLESSPFEFVRRPNPNLKEIPSFQVDSDSEADGFDPIDTGSSPLKPIKVAKVPAARELPYEDTAHPNTKHAMAPPPPPSDLDDSDSDELHSSPALTKTITIKREPSTPRSSLFSASHFKTPNSAPQPTTTAKSTAKLSRKEILRVQHSWTKKGRKVSPAPKQSHPRKRASLLSLHGKRAWDAGSVENSDDELAR